MLVIRRQRSAVGDTEADWLAGQLHLTLARSDLPALAEALAAWRRDDRAQVARVNAWLLSTRETAELRLQTTQMGRSLVEWLKNHDAAQAPVQWLASIEPTYPVAFALAAAPTGAAPQDVLLAYAFGWAENMMQAALKALHRQCPLVKWLGSYPVARR